MRRGRDAGEPHRRGVVFAMTLIVLLVASVTAYFVGRQSRTPGQIAAEARPPSPSLITARVRRAKPRAVLVFRGTLIDDHPEDVSYPKPSAALPVVTDVTARVHSVVRDGTFIGSVAGRPVIVFQGAVPAYRTMAFGETGIDIEELQAGLHALGISTGDDASGTYGASTAEAVSRLYQHYGFTVVAQPASVSQQSNAHDVQKYATVPLGEVTFVPALPATLVSVAPLGKQLDSTKPFAQLSSGRMSLTVKTDVNSARLLRAGLVGHAFSDITGRAIAVRITSVGSAEQSANPVSGPQAPIVFSPVSAAEAASVVGESLAVHVATGASKASWVVPVAALVTDAAGQSSITIVVHHKELTMPVRAGALLQGAQVIYPERGELRTTERVVVGIAAR